MHPSNTADDSILTLESAVSGRLVVIELAPPSERVFAGLRPSERDVATLVVDGRTNAAIASARGGSSSTVANQLASVFEELGVKSRAELVRLAFGGDLP